jgi:hypothetical protein
VDKRGLPSWAIQGRRQIFELYMAHGMKDVSPDFRIFLKEGLQEVADLLALVPAGRRTGIGNDG